MKLRPEARRTALSDEWDRIVRTTLRRGTPPEELEPRIDVDAFDPGAVAVARKGWLRRMVDETRSATVFSGLLPQLIEAEMPIDLQGVALRAAMDELRHGALCALVAKALGATPEAEIGDAAEGPAAHADCSPRARLIRNVIYTSCISETVSVALTAAEREEADEPLVSAVLDQLLGDETLHARFGWVCLEHVRDELDAEDQKAVEAYLPLALGHYENELRRRIGPPTSPGSEAERRDRARLGVTESALAHDVLHDTLRGVIAPRLRDAGFWL